MATNFKVAKRYAKALWLLAAEEKNTNQNAEAWMEALINLQTQTQGNADFAKVLSSAAVSTDQKWAVLKEICAKLDMPKPVERFLAHTTKAGRLPALGDITNAFTRLVQDATGVAEVLVESAIDLSAEELSRIAKQIELYTEKKAKVTVRKDPALLAGFKISVGGKTFDATLANNLQRMKKQLLMAEA